MASLFAANGHLFVEPFTPRCWEALQTAREIAREGGWDNLRTPHLFIGLLLRPDCVIARWAEYTGLDLSKLADQLVILFQQESGFPRPSPVPLHREFCSNSFIKVIQEAYLRTGGKSRSKIAPGDIAAVILRDSDSVVHQSLMQAGLSCIDLATLLETAEQAELSSQALA